MPLLQRCLAFFKFPCLYQNQLGGQITYGYDETDVNHGGSGQGHNGLAHLGHPKLRHQRQYGRLHSKPRSFTTISLDRLSQVVDPPWSHHHLRLQLPAPAHAGHPRIRQHLHRLLRLQRLRRSRQRPGRDSATPPTTAYDEYHRVFHERDRARQRPGRQRQPDREPLPKVRL